MLLIFLKHKQIFTALILPPLLSVFFMLAPFAVSAGFAQNQRDELGDAIGSFESLSSDKKRGMQREPWEKLAAEFGRIKSLPGNFAAEALFYEARSWEELADRSKKNSDYTLAVRLYGQLAQNYPRHTLADNALFNQAMILSGPLKDTAKAIKTLDVLLLQYPNGDMSAETVRLRSLLENKSVKRPAAAANSKATAAASASASPASPAASVAAAGKEASRQAPPSSPAQADARQDMTFQHPKGTVGVVNAKAPASGGLLSLLSWEAEDGLFTLTIGFAGQAKYKSSLLPPTGQTAAGTGRLVLDLLNTRLDPGVKKQLRFKDLLISEVRVNELNAETTRLALDLNNVRSYKISPLYKPYRLKLELSADQNLKGGSAINLPSKAGAAAGAASGSASLTNTGGKTAGTGSIVEQLGLGIKTVVVDAGHGGTDPGAIGNGITENKYTLTIALLLGKRLKDKGFNVIYTRNSDKKLDLKERTTLANEQKADIFISIHLNSSVKKDALGLEAYYLDVARSDAASVVAARENAVDVNATSDLQFILSDLTRNSKRDESHALSDLVLDCAIARLKKNGFDVRHNGVRSAPFFVLMGARMPAFLIEVGYLSNSADAARLKNKKYLDNLADGIAEGIVAYRNRINAIKP